MTASGLGVGVKEEAVRISQHRGLCVHSPRCLSSVSFPLLQQGGQVGVPNPATSLVPGLSDFDSEEAEGVEVKRERKGSGPPNNDPCHFPWQPRLAMGKEVQRG